MEGQLTGTAVRTLQKLGSHGNPWGFESGDCTPWAKEMKFLCLVTELEIMLKNSECNFSDRMF